MAWTIIRNRQWTVAPAKRIAQTLRTPIPVFNAILNFGHFYQTDNPPSSIEFHEHPNVPIFQAIFAMIAILI